MMARKPSLGKLGRLAFNRADKIAAKPIGPKRKTAVGKRPGAVKLKIPGKPRRG